MSQEIVIRVPETPLPRAFTESDEYQDLSLSAREAFVAHVRYMQETPFKLREWLDNGALEAELEDLMHRVDLDISINLRVPGADDVSPWGIRRSWVASPKPLISFLEPQHQSRLNQSVPIIGAPLSEVKAWVAKMADGASELFDAFFAAKSYDHAIAYLVAIYVCLAGLKFGLGRVGLRYPK